MSDSPQIIRTREQHYAYLPLVVPGSEVKWVMRPAMKEVEAVLRGQGVTPVGPWFAHYLGRPGDVCNLEVCWPVAQPIKPEERVKAGVWPAVTVARLLYRGVEAGRGTGWGELSTWVRGLYRAEGNEYWERFLVDSNETPNEAEWVTEMNWLLLD